MGNKSSPGKTAIQDSVTTMQSTVFEPMDMTTAEAVLKEAKQILDQLGLVFFLRHGTCLGAVRDNAFIEWDDDLDIGSVIGLHGLTEDLVQKGAEAFRERGYAVKVKDAELGLSVDMQRRVPPSKNCWACRPRPPVCNEAARSSRCR